MLKVDGFIDGDILDLFNIGNKPIPFVDFNVVVEITVGVKNTSRVGSKSLNDVLGNNKPALLCNKVILCNGEFSFNVLSIPKNIFGLNFSEYI